ncbi:hypothetical protein [Kibdelosporangium philippinense]|uniref:hypothetical protein n=1 Tax=Kibdelosporangium philippinense TaxID=211113 RepID=UPI003615DDE0
MSTVPSRCVKLLDSLPARLVLAVRRSRVQLTMTEPVDTRVGAGGHAGVWLDRGVGESVLGYSG